MAAKRASETAKSKRVFGRRQAPTKMFRVGLYAWVSTHHKQTLSLQMRAMREYADRRGWTIAAQIKEVGSGAAIRELRESLLAAARAPRDRCGARLAAGPMGPVARRSGRHGVGTGGTGCQFRIAHRSARSDKPTGRAMAGFLSVFADFEHEILRERIRAGIAEARLRGKHFGHPLTAAKKGGQIRKLYRAGISKAGIARRLEIGRTSVRRILADLTP
jgi:putative DNA-invertase from lambdoid prophage Rac